MGVCISKSKEEHFNLISNSNLDGYLHKYSGRITQNFLNFKKNSYVTIFLCDNDLVIKNDNFHYSIIYNNIIDWANYGYFYWTFSYMDHGLKKKYIMFHVDDAQIISGNLGIITKNIKRSYKNL